MSVADPGFPVGGGGGGPTSNVGAFRQKHMRKQKNWILLGGGGARTGGVPPDPPMHVENYLTITKLHSQRERKKNTTYFPMQLQTSVRKHNMKDRPFGAQMCTTLCGCLVKYFQKIKNKLNPHSY